MEAVAKIAYKFGHNMHRDFLEDVADEIVDGKWTKEELCLAVYWIPKRPDLCKEINYNRTITPAIFTAARDLFDVKRGRLLTHKEVSDIAYDGKTTVDQLFEAVTYDGKTWFVAK